jgi:hypothetical protein
MTSSPQPAGARESDPLDSPVIILGAARSGTTLVGGTLLDDHPQVRYWPEPSYVWRFGYAYRNHDVRWREDATPRVRDHIRAQFRRYMDGSSATRFVEKSPGNCFRMPFVLEIFPRAQVVHILRDGRDVVLSARREWSGTGTPRIAGERRPMGAAERIGRIFVGQTRLSKRVTDWRSLLELPAYAGRAFGVIRRHLFHSSSTLWGPVFPGLRQVRSNYSLAETCAIQWDLSVRSARSACAHLPAGQYAEFRYEDLVSRPREIVGRILEFLNLARDDDIVDRLAGKVEVQSKPKWPRELADPDLERVESLIGSTLQDLGYDLSARG